MKNFLLKYLFPILLSISSLPLLFFSFFIIFLGGDSCCGENTTGNMLVVTIVINAAYSILAGSLIAIYYFILKFSQKSEVKITTVIIGLCITIIPFVLINFLLWALLSISAFGFSEFINIANWRLV